MLDLDYNAVASALLFSEGTAAPPIHTLALSAEGSGFQKIAGVSRQQAAALLASTGGTPEGMQAAIFQAMVKVQVEDFHSGSGGGGGGGGGSGGGGSSEGSGGRTPKTPKLVWPSAPITCTICLDPKEAEECVVLRGCGHVCCAACVRSSAEAGRGQGTGVALCPEQGCGSAITHRDLRALLGMELFNKLDRGALEVAVSLDPSLHLCPTPDCTFICCWASEESDGKPILDCPLCQKSTCLACKRQPFHEGATCAAAAAEAAGGGGGEAAAAASAAAQAEAATQAFFKDPASGVKFCAQCHTPLNHVYGCWKFKCKVRAAAAFALPPIVTTPGALH